MGRKWTGYSGQKNSPARRGGQDYVLKAYYGFAGAGAGSASAGGVLVAGGVIGSEVMSPESLQPIIKPLKATTNNNFFIRFPFKLSAPLRGLVRPSLRVEHFFHNQRFSRLNYQADPDAQCFNHIGTNMQAVAWQTI